MTSTDLTARLIDLLQARSITHGDFVLASGRRSTYYIDARRTTMCADGLSVIGDLGLLTIHNAGWVADGVGGLTLGADPVAYAIARASAASQQPLDAFTVRKAAKTHGQKRRIEGLDVSGRAVIVVEDVITTGGSALEAIDAVEQAGASVVGVLAVVDRQEGGQERIAARGFPVVSLTSASSLGLGVDR